MLKMKKTLAVLAAALLSAGLYAQDGKLYLSGVNESGRAAQTDWESIRRMYDAGM